MNRHVLRFLLLCALACLTVTSTAAEPTLELRDGDRVVLVGSTLVEREQNYGYLETALTARYHNRAIVFRNLGWSGDTVFGLARARFGSVADGFTHLREHVLALKPTVIVLGYGTNESYEGQAGLPAFIAGYETLLKALEPSGARLVFIAPLKNERLAAPLPDPAEHNRDVRLYRDAIRDLAQKHGGVFIDLYALLGESVPLNPADRLTYNGIHLSPYGYWRAAFAVERGLPAPTWRVELTAAGVVNKADGTKLSDVKRTADGLMLTALDAQLPDCPPPSDAPAWAPGHSYIRTLAVQGLPSGSFELTIDGEPVAVATHEQWAAGVRLLEGPERQQADELRKRINHKNELYFHRWRPQNETYLFLFRKHEQGNNAVEIPQFDPLIAADEQQIRKLAQPMPHRYAIKKVAGK